MRHLKVFENFDKDLLEDIADLFLEIKDKYDLTRVDDLYEHGMASNTQDVYEVRYTDGPDTYILISIFFDDSSASSHHALGYLKEVFKYDVSQFIEKAKLLGCDGRVDWDGGSIYQIVFNIN